MPRVDAVIELPYGRIRGAGDGAYLGIPYAAAPVGDRRWRAPAPPEAWRGVRDASRPGPPAPQPKRPISDFAHGPTPPGEEHCLTLNVWTPPGDDGPWPVLVWSIGGGWAIGWTGSGIYDGAALAEAAGVVVVTFTYRLGSLGWLCHPDLAHRSGDATANWGLLDHVAVLEWVGENISAFGGDPARVTMGGQSAGASNVAGLLVAPGAENLFSRALLHSPPLAEAANDPARGARWSEDLARVLTRSPRVNGLREVPADQVVAGHEALLAEAPWRGTRGAAWPALDPATLPVSPLDAPAARPHVPVIVGTMRDEATFLFRAGGRHLELDGPRLEAMVGRMSGVQHAASTIARNREEAAAIGEPVDPESLLVRIATSVLFTAPAQRWARARAAAGAQVHLFRVDHPSPDPRLGALHTIDVPLLFGTFRTSEVAAHYVQDDERTREVSRAMTTGWTAFLHGGEPGWPRLGAGRTDVQIFGTGDS